MYENVAFAMEIVEASRKEIRRQVPAVLSMVGLASKANHYPGQLSGGEQQRAALARAIVNNPSILIADEPTGNLDSATAREIMKIINMINHRGTTVIMATHAKDIVNSMRKRVVTFIKEPLFPIRRKGSTTLKIRTWRRMVKQGFQNVFRNRIMSLASISAIAAALFVLGLVMVIVMNINNMISDLESQVEITLFLKTGANSSDISSVRGKSRAGKGLRITSSYPSRKP